MNKLLKDTKVISALILLLLVIVGFISIKTIIILIISIFFMIVPFLLWCFIIFILETIIEIFKKDKND